MIISLENRYIFIAVPKTGTTSIQRLLLENDPTVKKNGIEIDGKKFSFQEHDTALSIKKNLGSYYSKFRIFGFIRNPYSRIVSSYFFYKNGKPITPGNKRLWPPRIRIGYARICPFKLWAITYPYKSNIESLVDENRNLIVDFVGTFENLKEDLTKIFTMINIDVSTESLKHTNKSDHSKYIEYYKNKTFKDLINKKINEDLNFYEKYKFTI